MRKLIPLFLATMLFGACSNSKDYSQMEENAGNMLSNWIPKDTTIDAVALGISNFEILEPIYSSKYRVRFNIIDTYKDLVLGTIYAQAELKKDGFIQVSGTKLSILVDSIFQNNVKVDKNTSPLNSVIFLNEKEVPSNESKSGNTLEDAVRFMKDAGIEAYIDSENYLVWEDISHDVHANPNDVAKLTYEMFTDISLLKGVRIKDANGKVIGQYTK